MVDAKADRIETVSTSLEAQFHICRQETDTFLAWVKKVGDGMIAPAYIEEFLKLVRMNAQLAGVIARLDTVKNRNSKTQ